MNGASYVKHLRDDLIPAVEAIYPNKDFTFARDSAPSHRANKVHNFLKQKLPLLWWSLLLSFHNDWWVEEKNLQCLGWMCNGSPLNPQINETVSPPFGSRWRKRRRLNKNCFWIDIKKKIYLLNTFWLCSFYEIIVSQFSCNQIKLDRKRKFDIIFWRQIFHFSRV